MKSNLKAIMITIVTLFIIFNILEIPRFTQEIQELKEQKTIHEKLDKISGLNCSELTDYFENGRNCSGVPPHYVCRYPESNRQNALYMMLLQNCTG